MATVLLVRHGLTAMTGPVLAGHTPGVHLDERGRAQAEAVAARLAPVPLAAVVTSPLERCLETAAAVAGRAVTLASHGRAAAGRGPVRRLDRPAAQGAGQAAAVEGRAGPPVRGGVPRPGGRGAGRRAGPGGRRGPGVGRPITASAGPDAVWLACSHGDIIKAVLADALGLHLDLFQRIVVDPCSVSVVRYTDTRPFVLRVNDTGGDVAALLPPPKRRRRRKAAADAAVGGGAGPG